MINKIFGGYLRSQIQSCESNYVSNTYDPFVDLSLPIMNNINSVEKALKRYILPDKLDGVNKYKHPKYVINKSWI